MTLVEAVRARLLAISAVTALVGTRVTTLKFQQNSRWPAMRLQQIDRIETIQLRGGVSVCRARVQIDTVTDEATSADPYATAHAVAAAARGTFAGGVATGLHGWRGTVAGSPPFTVTGVRLIDERDEYEAEELRQVRVSQDYFVTFLAA